VRRRRFVRDPDLLAGSAVVTGSARRVGRVLAEGLVAEGWRVAVHSSDQRAADRTAAEIGALGGIGADLATVEGCAALANAAHDMLDGTCDLLVNNASSFVRARPGSITPADLAEAFDVNVRAPVLLIQGLQEALEHGAGLVVNVSDHAAHEHWPAYAAHAASKAALESLTVSFARGLAPRVRVNAIAPATILAPDAWSDERVRSLAERGLLGDPRDLLDAVLRFVDQPMRTGELLVLGLSAVG
jgi:pteridine reductase